MSLDVCGLLIMEHTAIGDIVYDPFMGSGTTAVASIKNYRNYLGSEIDEKVKKLAENRLVSY